MFVVIVDQVDSRRRADAVDATIAAIVARHGDRLRPPPERTAGDEFEAVTAEAGTALELLLELSRGEHWSVGLGIGPVELPLAPTTRASRGPAFVAARESVERAKRRSSRVAVRVEDGAPFTGAQLEGLIDPVLAIRARRSVAGWELAELLDAGLSQSAAAERLGVTPQAVSQRADAAELRIERAARPALLRLLTVTDVWASVETTER